MGINFYRSNHVLENRVYISPLPKEEIAQAVFESGKELTGAGIRTYSYIVGWILSFAGKSSKINIGGENFYINNKSFSKLVMRAAEMGPVNSPKEASNKLHEIYIRDQKTGYDEKKLKLVNEGLKAFLKKDIKDMSQMFSELKKIAQS